MPAVTPPDVKNLFCRLRDLSNEASVEQFFVNRLLEELGYADRQIKPKTSLQELHVNLGRRRLLYKPDYVVEYRRKARWIVDAKAVGEPLDDFVGQCSGYCLALNRAYNDNPVEFFVLTDGASTRLYRWDREEPLLQLDFADFVEGNPKLAKLREILEPSSFSKSRDDALADEAFLTLKREPIDEVNAAFSWCHQAIHKKDSLSQAAAFTEFVKIVFLKLISDREVHERHPEFATQDTVELPIDEVRFSLRWIQAREADHPNPLDQLQFQGLLEQLEEEIQAGKRKRVFERHERINLSPETIKAVVEKLQHIDLFGIDADLNGRLFETFLNATMRGKDLGQFFTPRSVVKLGVRLCRLQAGRDRVDTVIDACCGTGGFLIDVLADMWAKVDANRSLSSDERYALKRKIAERCLVGIDVARDPQLARIARMNMYLHGDGGSSIYQVDALNKRPPDNVATDGPELRAEIRELRNRLETERFDVALTNPPFAKSYERRDRSEARILDEYELAFETTRRGARRPVSNLRSSVMFLERYYDVLKPGGQLVTVIDDGVLGSDSYARVRDWLRERFLIRAVISLPGDAFQRSLARVKTSIIVLEKKHDENDNQPSVFMYYTTAVGIDDSPRQRALPIDQVNRERAKKEVAEVAALYEAFLDGKEEAQPWTVPADRVQGRIDVKSCLPKAARQVHEWEERGITRSSLVDYVDVVHPAQDLPDDLVAEVGEANAEALVADGDGDPDLIVTATTHSEVTHLRARYDGFAEPGEKIVASNSTYPVLYRVHEGDIVISHINAVHGAVCVVPAELDGTVVTSEYTVCRAKPGIDPRLVWLMLRTPEMRSDLLLLSTGIGRSRVKWENAKQLTLPTPPADLAREVTVSVRKAEELEAAARELRADAESRVLDELALNSDEAKRIIAAFKPPK